ncbi:hypothetical protein C4D60_Mb06t29970 [Musa balbisiana]|uniref:Endoglucanase n=1 Tax=Musa balbisiana TaxID=52838 RepID=A0A4S8ISG0_MUSBA|nr:hypothetical protein C4D60_Mb06t29970 [Musa balbisiana]
MEESSKEYVHSISGTGRLLPSAGRWNSIEVDFGLIPTSSYSKEASPLMYAKSYDFRLSVQDKSHLKRFIYIVISLILVAAAAALLTALLPRKHAGGGSLSGLPLALDYALLFFDAQKSGFLPKSNPVKFRGNSGLHDGEWKQDNTSLVGGFYDSGNNIKFSFTTAYAITLLSWTVIEYSHKYAAIGQLEHVGGANDDAKVDNDIACWQRPEDMTYPRPVFKCKSSTSDLAGEIIAALAAASLVFDQEDANYSTRLAQTSQTLYELATKNHIKGTYSEDKDCGVQAANLYNSSSYKDELVWGATWLFLATGNFTYLSYATENFEAAVEEALPSDTGVFYWNNKVAANAVLLTRLRYLRDPGNPYESTLKTCSDMANMIICSYLSTPNKFSMTPGGLILLQPNKSAPLHFAATAAFLSKIYGDYLNIINIPGANCGSEFFPLERLQSFARSQVNYMLGDNPMKMSYLVGFGDHFPEHVHHRAASIPWDGHNYSCSQGERWRDAKESNPNVLLGAVVAGPDEDEGFLDTRNRPEYTEPTIAGNAGVVAALVALVDEPITPRMNEVIGGMDRDKIFSKIIS